MTCRRSVTEYCYYYQLRHCIKRYLDRKEECYMVTQKDISAACGVSVAAVSRALSDHHDISEATKQRIRDVAEKMGYGNIRTVKKRQPSRRIGILATGSGNSIFHREILQEIRNCLIDRGYDLVILSPVDGETEAGTRPGYLSRARLLQLDGIILFSSIREDEFCLQKERKELRDLIFGEIPVVAVDCRFASCACVLPDYEAGIRNLFEYVYELGHRRIAFVYGRDIGNENIWEKTIRALLREKRIWIPPQYNCGLEAENVMESYRKTTLLLQEDVQTRPTCILYGDDYLLEGGMEAVKALGKRIPQDLSAVSMCMPAENGGCMNTVTSWRLPVGRIAREAADLLLQKIQDPESIVSPVRTVSGEFLEGGTAAELSVGSYQKAGYVMEPMLGMCNL